LGHPCQSLVAQRLRTNEAKLSSSLLFRGIRRSSAILALPVQLKIGDVMKATAWTAPADEILRGEESIFHGEHKAAPITLFV